MFSRSRGMVWLAVAAVVITVPALAQGQGSPSTASYTAFDTGGGGPTFRWYVTDTTATDVALAQRGTVTFSSRHERIPHNVDFTDEVKPECQLSGSDTASTGPMPPTPTPNWSGTCTFAQPGAYHFVCDRLGHEAMTGTITVAATPAATASPTPVPPGTITVAATPAATASPTPVPPAAPAPPANRPLATMWLAVGHHQQGSPVSGSLIVSRPGTRVEIALLSRRVALGLSGRRRVQVGRSVIASAPAGPMKFSVALNATARRALRERKTLPVLVQVKASGPLTTPYDRVQAVRLGRAPGRAR